MNRSSNKPTHTVDDERIHGICWPYVTTAHAPYLNKRRAPVRCIRVFADFIFRCRRRRVRRRERCRRPVIYDAVNPRAGQTTR